MATEQTDCAIFNTDSRIGNKPLPFLLKYMIKEKLYLAMSDT